MESVLRRSLVLTYAFPSRLLRDLVGPGLQLLTHKDFGFLAIAMVETTALRPKGWPAALGKSFFLSGYRIFTRLHRPGRATLTGLRILRSDTDSRSMAWLSRGLTHYRFHHAYVDVKSDTNKLHIRARTPNHEADVDVVAHIANISNIAHPSDASTSPAPLPESSPFDSLEEAKRFAGPLPYTFDHEPETNSIVVIKGVRKAWSPIQVRVDVREATYLTRAPFVDASPRLASAFYLANVPYAWNAGFIEKLAQ